MPPPTATRQATLLVAFMWGANILNYCDRQAVFAMFPASKADLGLTDTQLGITGSIFLWVYGIGCPIAGQIADTPRSCISSARSCSLLVSSLFSAATTKEFTNHLFNPL